jgi:hypothetical protein
MGRSLVGWVSRLRSVARCLARTCSMAVRARWRSARWPGLWGQGSARGRCLVGAPAVLDLGRRVAPGPLAPGRVRHGPSASRTEPGRSASIARPVARRRQARVRTTCRYCRPRGIGFQPAVAALLVLAQLPLPIMGPVDLLGGHRQSTRYAGRVVIAAAQPAKHAGRLVTGGLLIGGQRLLGLLAMRGGPARLAAAIPGGLIQLAPQPVRSARNSAVEIRWRSGLLGVSTARAWPPVRDSAWASCR